MTRPREPLRVAIAVAMTIPFLAIAALMIFAGRRVLRAEQRYASFRPAPAVVLRAAVEARPAMAGGTRRWVPRVAFRYEVGGTGYVGSRVTPTDEAGTRSWADAVVAGYHTGETVTAWVDPAAPGRAFLVRHRSILPYLLIGLAVLAYATVAAIVLRRLLVGARRRREN